MNTMPAAFKVVGVVPYHDGGARHHDKSHLVIMAVHADECLLFNRVMLSGEVGGWGRDPKKCTGRDWGMGSSTIQ